ncbi:MAG: hypothetical protein WCK31_02255 [bacterium]
MDIRLNTILMRTNLNKGFSVYLFIYLLTSIVTIFGIRSFLTATNFPQLSTSDFHIAHLLYGGIIMLIVILANFVLKPSIKLKLLSAIGVGIGFGFFWDEIGKFISQSNDYFFKPALPIIYISFIVQFFIFLYMIKFDGKGKEELDEITKGKNLGKDIVKYIIIGLTVFKFLLQIGYIINEITTKANPLEVFPIIAGDIVIYSIMVINLLKQKSRKLRNVIVVLMILHFIILGSYALYLGEMRYAFSLIFDLVILILFTLHTN